MDRGEIIESLTALANELERRGLSAEMYVVGDRLDPAARFFVEQVFEGA